MATVVAVRPSRCVALVEIGLRRLAGIETPGEWRLVRTAYDVPSSEELVINDFDHSGVLSVIGGIAVYAERNISLGIRCNYAAKCVLPAPCTGMTMDLARICDPLHRPQSKHVVR